MNRDLLEASIRDSLRKYSYHVSDACIRYMIENITSTQNVYNLDVDLDSWDSWDENY